MNERDVANMFDRANASFEKAGETHDRVAVRPAAPITSSPASTSETARSATPRAASGSG